MSQINYIDNEKFYTALVEYKHARDLARERDEPPPMVPHYIGECFMKIARNISYRYNFINYTFKDELISDGIVACLHTLQNSDPTLSKNQFTYYTYIVYFSFVQRIKREEAEHNLKFRILENEYNLEELLSEVEDENIKQNLMDQYKNYTEKVQEREVREKKYKPAQKETTPSLLD